MSETKELTPREKLVRAKIAAGLRPEQAEQVVANQEAHDAELARAGRKTATNAK